MSISNPVMAYSHSLSKEARFFCALTAVVVCLSASQARAETGSESPETLSVVTVQGEKEATKTPASNTYNPKQNTLTKYTSSIKDTPQTVSVVSKKVIQDQNITSVKDALKNVAGISMSAGEGGFQGDAFNIRGFSGRSDIFLDGMRSFGSYNRDSFNLEQVEVFKGPSSLSFGRGSTGGIVNQVTKTPKLEELREVTLGLGTDLQKRATADINHRMNETTAVRFNLMGQQGDVAGRENVETERYGFAGSVATGLGTDTRFNLDYVHQSDDNIADYGLPWLTDKPLNLDRDTFFGFSDGDKDYFETQADVITAKIEHDLTDKITLRNQMRYGSYERNFRITNPTIADITVPVSQMVIERRMIAGESTESAFNNQTDIIAKFNTGSVKHSVVAGVEYASEKSEPTRYNIDGVPSTTALNPSQHTPFSGTTTVRSIGETTVDTVSAYALDTVSLTDQLDVVGGVRYDRAESDFTDVLANTEDSRTDHMVSWKGGIVYKPVKNGSVYASAGTSFNPSTEGLSLSASNANTKPEKTISYEIGTKWDFFNKRLSASGALFRIEKTNARTPDLLDPTVNILTGEQRVDGIEVGLMGKITPEWDVLASYAYMHSEVRKSNNPDEIGNPLANTPHHTFSLWTTYQTPFDMKVGAGMTGQSGRNARTSVNTTTGVMQTLPGYVTFDAMASYPITDSVDLQLNIYNIADNQYYDQIHPSHVVPASGRTAVLSTRFNF